MTKGGSILLHLSPTELDWGIEFKFITALYNQQPFTGIILNSVSGRGKMTRIMFNSDSESSLISLRNETPKPAVYGSSY